MAERTPNRIWRTPLSSTSHKRWSWEGAPIWSSTGARPVPGASMASNPNRHRLAHALLTFARTDVLPHSTPSQCAHHRLDYNFLRPPKVLLAGSVAVLQAPPLRRPLSWLLNGVGARCWSMSSASRTAKGARHTHPTDPHRHSALAPRSAAPLPARLLPHR